MTIKPFTTDHGDSIRYADKPKDEAEEPRADHIRSILSDVEFGKMKWSVTEFAGGTCEIQPELVVYGATWRGVCWTIAPEATKRTILETAFHAACNLSNDLIRDKYFQYKGECVFAIGTNHSKLLED